MTGAIISLEHVPGKNKNSSQSRKRSFQDVDCNLLIKPVIAHFACARSSTANYMLSPSFEVSIIVDIYMLSAWKMPVLC